VCVCVRVLRVCIFICWLARHKDVIISLSNLLAVHSTVVQVLVRSQHQGQWLVAVQVVQGNQPKLQTLLVSK
jgi:hypothetical protein